jgi:hypothetical protein
MDSLLFNTHFSLAFHTFREFWKVKNMKPPFTYSALIKQALIESPDKKLTKSQVHKWFEDNFMHFRSLPANHSWKVCSKLFKIILFYILLFLYSVFLVKATLNKQSSSRSCFYRMPNEHDEKNPFWAINENLYAKSLNEKLIKESSDSDKSDSNSQTDNRKRKQPMREVTADYSNKFGWKRQRYQ